jgi:plasmid stabilization system protein ParE
VAQTEVVFHPEASTEYGEAYDWYAGHDPRAAERFEREVEDAVQRILEHPHRWPKYDETHRKLLLRRFPYLLIYREHGKRIWIVAVAHGHRRPGYWKKRTIPT